MYLYDIAAEYRTLFDQLEEMQENAATEEERVYIETAWFDTLDGLDGALEVKAENIAAYIKELKAFADDMRAAEKALADRRHPRSREEGGFDKMDIDRAIDLIKAMY